MAANNLSRVLKALLVLAFAVGAHATPALATTIVSTSTISQNTTWTAAGSPYVLNVDVTVASGATLTLQPGVIVKAGGYDPFNMRSLTIASGATLNAQGTAAAPIYFTSIRDDSVGGDTGGDGPTSCTRGNWGQITIKSATANVISNATIQCGGTANSPSILGLLSLTTGSALTLSDVTLGHANKPAIYTAGASLDATNVNVTDVTTGIYLTSASVATISHSSVQGLTNGNGIRAENSTVAADHNTITNNWIGVLVMLSANTTAGVSSFLDNTIANNTADGFEFTGMQSWTDLPPESLWPYGHRNNIYGNRSSYSDKHQLDTPNTALLDASPDWSGNYWGDYVTEVSNPDECQYALYPDHYTGYVWAIPGVSAASPGWYASVWVPDGEDPEHRPPKLCVRTYANLEDWSSTPFTG
jgi:Right handed beta helix region